MSRNAHAPRRRLRNRLMLAFATFTVVVAAVFALYVLLFVYTVEDHLFEAMLEREVAAQLQHHRDHGMWATPRDGFMSVVTDMSALPDGMADVLRQEPRRREFSGAAGRHYHLRPLDPPGAAGPRAWLVAEVSSLLAVRPMRTQILHLLFWTGVAVVTLALLLGGWLAHRITAPLSRLAQAVGDATPERLPPNFAAAFPDDEVGLLARRLDDLIARVRAFVEREREFTRDASHELRTPLTVIRTATERLGTEPGLSEAARRSLDHIAQSSRHLEQTVMLLLSLAREQAAPGPANATAVLPVLERVVVEQSPLLDNKQVDVHVDVASHHATNLPTTVLNILLSNLVGNAFAHTREGRIAIAMDGDTLCVSNPGAGVRDVDFQPFIKHDDSAGFGLGLSIVQRLCERHGIDLRIESVPGRTVARLTLPAA
jgi:signal transduction histidine kinase